MTLSGYMEDHWGVMVLIVGMAIVLRSDIHLERRKVMRIAVTCIMLFLYSISCYVETYLGNRTEYTVLRSVLSAVNYSLVAFILLNIILIMYPDQKAYLYFPALLNSALCFISLPTGIVFYISDDNHFHRGMLGYLTYFISGLYLTYLIFNIFRSLKNHKEDFLLPLYLSITAVMCLLMPLFFEGEARHWFNITIAIDVMLYYIFLLQQYTKRDSLTNLLNRQSYYSDAERFSEHITAIVTMDMNGLKELNDSDGHVAGDLALKTLADCFRNAAQHRQRVYRIGGDEYVILCVNSSESDVLELVKRIRHEVSETSYTCSVGYAMKTEESSIDKLYQKADHVLYEDKQRFYEISGKNRQKRRS